MSEETKTKCPDCLVGEGDYQMGFGAIRESDLAKDGNTDIHGFDLEGTKDFPVRLLYFDMRGGVITQKTERGFNFCPVCGTRIDFEACLKKAKPEPATLSTANAFLRNLYALVEEDGWSGLTEALDWPSIDYDGEPELLDTENLEILELTDSSITIACGGDWQDPQEVRLELRGINGSARVRVVSVKNVETFRTGLDYDETMETLRKLIAD